MWAGVILLFPFQWGPTAPEPQSLVLCRGGEPLRYHRRLWSPRTRQNHASRSTFSRNHLCSQITDSRWVLCCRVTDTDPTTPPEHCSYNLNVYLTPGFTLNTETQTVWLQFHLKSGAEKTRPEFRCNCDSEQVLARLVYLQIYITCLFCLFIHFFIKITRWSVFLPPAESRTSVRDPQQRFCQFCQVTGRFKLTRTTTHRGLSVCRGTVTAWMRSEVLLLWKYLIYISSDCRWFLCCATFNFAGCKKTFYNHNCSYL